MAPRGLIYQGTSPIREGSPLMTPSPPRRHLLTQSSWGVRVSAGQGM